jgi:hypothetical protein
MCAEFKINYPSNVTQSTITSNDAIIAIEIGNLADGIAVCYLDCETEWHWPYHQTLWVTSHEHTVLEITAHPAAGAYHFTNCNPGGYELEIPLVLTNLHLNHMDDF